MTSKEIRNAFLRFFEKRGHSILPSFSLIPQQEAGETNATLFNTAGMQPLIPYLLGREHPKGKRLASAQKCIRTIDIDEVGDNTHASFFEMLGNWSLGDYFKKESIQWSWEFLTSKEEGLGLDPRRIYVTIFSGGEIDGVQLNRDEESYQIWSELFQLQGLNPEQRIFEKLKDNWWSAGDNSPSGTTTEIFYDLTGNFTDGLSPEDFFTFEDEQKLVEIWNNVFMEYVKEGGKVIGELPSKNVDTGAGLERVTAVLQGSLSIFDTDIFRPLIKAIRDTNEKINDRSARIIADHLKTSFFILSEGIKPSNSKQGYVLRRLLRKSFREMVQWGIEEKLIQKLYEIVQDLYDGVYELSVPGVDTLSIISREWERYMEILKKGEKRIRQLSEKKKSISGEDLAYLEQTEGLPFEIAIELIEKFQIPLENNYKEEYEKVKREHQKKSKTAGAGLFKGGLAGDTPKIRALHTATHLMLAGLRKELGDHVTQKGSNITEERTRFDFTHPEKVSRKVLDRVEEYVNNAISTNAHVSTDIMKKEEAKSSGVVGAFWEKYPEEVKVWTIKDKEGNIYSRELCGGPHVEHLSEIAQFGRFRIKKEGSSSSGVRRIRAVLE